MMKLTQCKMGTGIGKLEWQYHSNTFNYITAGGLLVIYSSTASQTRLLEQAVISQICNFTNSKNAISIRDTVHE